jgi:hypothetical protein
MLWAGVPYAPSSQVSSYRSADVAAPAKAYSYHREHLWRRHKLPDYPCARCHTGFNANQDLIAHLRAPASLQCTISDDCPPEGIDAEKYKKIKERKYPNKTDDARKWEDIFQIIFPDDLIPSPCKLPLRSLPLTVTHGREHIESNLVNRHERSGNQIQ